MGNKIADIKPDIVEILSRNEVAKAGIFGSYARGEQTENSDIDILIEFSGRKSLFDLVRAERELGERLKRKFELVTYNSLNPLIRDSVLADEVRII
jgi:uncharacterized protein